MYRENMFSSFRMDLLLGMPWLREMNPEIHWIHRVVKCCDRSLEMKHVPFKDIEIMDHALVPLALKVNDEDHVNHLYVSITLLANMRSNTTRGGLNTFE